MIKCTQTMIKYANNRKHGHQVNQPLACIIFCYLEEEKKVLCVLNEIL